MSEMTPVEAARVKPPEIERITGPDAGLLIYEAFNARMRLTPEMKGAFLQDTAQFMAGFFEQRGHKVNGFNVTVAANNRMQKAVRAGTGDIELDVVVVHVVQGGVSSTIGMAHSVSDYI